MDEKRTLRSDKNPAFADCKAKYWLAYRDGKIVGRIAGIINQKYIEKWGNKYARFGWIDFIDDSEVSRALFGAVESWAMNKGMKGIHGPLGFTDLDKEGLLVEGFEEPGTMLMLYNYDYYRRHIEDLGYTKDAEWVEYQIRTPDEIPEKVIRVGNLALKRGGFRLVRARKPKDLKRYAREIFEILNTEYADLYATVPLSAEQIDAYIKQYFSFIDPRFNKVILDKQERVAAFGIALPSLTRALQKSRGRIFPFGFLYILNAMKNTRALDLGLVAVRNEYRKLGLPAILMTEITKSAIDAGIKSAESSGELEDNDQVQAFWRHYNARIHKRRRAYFKALQTPAS
jgi:ribosomal protein S18 acetylase RimI-like enzyme